MSGLPCGSLFVYATKGQTDLSRSIRYFILNIKQGRIEPKTRKAYAVLAAHRLASEHPAVLMPFFGEDVALVPVPGSGLTKPNTVWPAQDICEALQEAGLVHFVVPMLRRAAPVPKSAGSINRPLASQHAESFALAPPLDFPYKRILLVDDVVTRGCTLLGAAARVRQAFPEIPLTAFALARVQSEGEATVPRAPKIEELRITRDGCKRLDVAPSSGSPPAQPGLFG